MADALSLGKKLRTEQGASPDPRENPEPKARKREGLSYLERSTARRETSIPGIAGKDKKGRAAGAEARRAGAPPSDETWERNGGASTLRFSQRPRRMYDQKAISIAKTLSKAEARRAAQKGRTKDTAKLLVALALILAVGAGFYFAVPEVTRIEKVLVKGMATVSEQEIISALMLSPEINLVNADIPAMESRILENPKIAAARILRGFPDSLTVQLQERKAVACVLVTEEIGTRSIAIDASGIAFAYLETVVLDRKIPVLSGIRFERFTPGQRLPEYLIPLLGDIAELSSQSPSMLDAFSEIKIEKISDTEAELLLFPSSGKTVPIRMPARLTAANLGSALLVLDILAGRKGAELIEEIDFRTGTIVYKTKEAQAG